MRYIIAQPLKTATHNTLRRVLAVCLALAIFISHTPAQARFLQEDPLWLNAGDLNLYRYTGNNPVNRTDPSGMTAQERQSIDGIGLALINGGTIATRLMLSTGVRTAQFLAQSNKVALSTIAGSIACGFFTLADAVAQAGPNTKIVAVDPTRCGVVAISVPSNRDKPKIYFPPLFGNQCSCNCQAGDVGYGVWRYGIGVAPDCRAAAKMACTKAVNRVPNGYANIHHAVAICSNGGRYSGGGKRLN